MPGLTMTALFQSFFRLIQRNQFRYVFYLAVLQEASADAWHVDM